MLLIRIIAILIICYFIECGIIHNQDDDVEKKSVHHKVKHFVHRRCKLRGHSTRLEEIDRLAEEAKVCFEKPLPHHYTADTVEELREICFEKRKEVIKCFERFDNLSTPCFPPEEAYIPAFVTEAYEGYSQYLCQHIDVLTFSGMLQTNLIKCLNKFMRHKEYNPQYVCYDNATFVNHTDGTIITKEDLCKDFDLIYDCYEHQFKEHCPEAPKAWEFQSGLLNGMRAPCRKDNTEE
ncbi:hypothetical protein ILUMI_04931 [Ignelater luminosus]|uniref:Uncharacterized protein n=1 Tax=Ignelater luminosus TaxID=2038154 RepID=A0A8K0DBJ4_IGNLU|nr:hypothetical protein ILUMI_04931 [Ignelater luminosus]